MIEKVRVSLWDIFTFFLTGLLLTLWLVGYLWLSGRVTSTEMVTVISALPASVTLFLAPLTLTAIGMVYEPPANYFDKLVNPFWFKVFPRKERHENEEKALQKLIKEKYLGNIGESISNPYHLCKEYVETKQLSTTFMVFLSRYGFYRNIAFLAILSIPLVWLEMTPWWVEFVATAFLLFIYIVLKLRAEDFYSYMAPCVYRCYLIDKALGVGNESA